MVETLVTVAILCNNLNWQTSPRCNAPVETIELTDNGFEGHLTTGVYWEQYWVADNAMRFRMEDVTWLIVDGVIVE